MMKIARSKNQKRRNEGRKRAVEILDQLLRRREAQPRAPFSRVERRHGKITLPPGIIEVQMKSGHADCKRKLGECARAIVSKRFIIAIATKSNNRKPPEEKKKPDLFCRVRNAFAVVARKSSNALGSAWGF